MDFEDVLEEYLYHFQEIKQNFSNISPALKMLN